MRVQPLTPAQKAEMIQACERLIAEALKPRFLPQIQPTGFNYPIDIVGKLRASRYSFAARFRSGFPHNAGEEFDAPFARIDHLEESSADLRFNVMWRRHTGQWWRLHAALPLDEALRLVASDPVLRPPV